jgi:large subunit ribosomal protein L14e
VEPGRVCYVNYGEDYGKLVVIVDMVDTGRVLIDSHDKSMPRCIYPLSRLSLTKIKVAKVHRGCRTGTLIKKQKKGEDIVAAFKKTPVSVKMEKYKLRKSLSDFDRFKVMVLRKQRSYQRGHLNAKIKKPAPKKKVEEKKPDPPKKQDSVKKQASQREGGKKKKEKGKKSER